MNRTPRQDPLYARFNRRNAFATISDSPLFARGEVSKPTEKVARGTLSFLAEKPLKIARHESGRKQLAEWMIEQPLTARVMVNRIWHWIFGRGLVPSVDNFGMTGDEPSHPELLDYLALQFKQQGWSIKKMVRSLVLSHTYQLSSALENRALEIDPDNKYLWRHTPRRLQAEEIRDSMLAASGQLEWNPPLGSVVARHGDGPIGGPRLVSLSDSQLMQADGIYRSVYLPVARNAVPLILQTFDFPDSDVVQGAREVTNVPSQALFLLNSDFVKVQAEKLAGRIVAAYPGNALDSFPERFALATRLVFGREPKPAERELARNYLVKQGAPSSRDRGRAAWVSLCRSLLASAEFRLLD
ncbi:MAG TPA: DUF1553 domain-containing protein, partial [Gemmatales bacterium]|nr:DUF1553 domain-containing protein [Gemmatales bacterium]